MTKSEAHLKTYKMVNESIKRKHKKIEEALSLQLEENKRETDVSPLIVRLYAISS